MTPQARRPPARCPSGGCRPATVPDPLSAPQSAPGSYPGEGSGTVNTLNRAAGPAAVVLAALVFFDGGAVRAGAWWAWVALLASVSVLVAYIVTTWGDES